MAVGNSFWNRIRSASVSATDQSTEESNENSSSIDADLAKIADFATRSPYRTNVTSSTEEPDLYPLPGGILPNPTGNPTQQTFSLPAAESELSFISGVNASGTVIGTSYWTWNGNNPATYDPSNSLASKWGSATPETSGGVVYYYFDPASNWNATEQSGFASALNLWQDEINIQFVQTTNAAQANFTFYRGGGGAYEQTSFTSYAAIGSNTLSGRTGASIHVDTSIYGFGNIGGDFSYAGGYSYETIVHEIGHSLGLGHGGAYNGDVNSSQQQFSPYDTRLWSIMSYIEPQDTTSKYYSSYPVTGTSWRGNDPTTPQILDLIDTQRLYGVATSGPLASGGVHFGFNTNIYDNARRYFDFTVNKTPVVTLWAGGSNNTLDVSGFYQNATINLNPDTFSSVDGLVNNIGIADGTRIDHVIGGSGNDTFILNNSLASTVTGGGGNDIFRASKYGWLSSTITDTSVGDTINLTDADPANFHYSLQGTSLAYGDVNITQTMSLSNNPRGHFIETTDAVGGVDLRFARLDDHLNDFFGSGHSSILWQNDDGSAAVWNMYGNTPYTGATVAINPGPSWHVEGSGYFSTSKAVADILWQNDDGSVAIWDVNGGANVTGVTLPINPGSSWHVKQAGDFNGDSNSDILWQNDNGAVSIWLMNGTSLISGQTLGINPGANWKVVGDGDFNMDGKADILWQNTDGSVAVWLMNGQTLTGGATLSFNPGSDWHAIGAGDFEETGYKHDILFQNNNGALAIWNIQGTSVVSGVTLGANPGNVWQVHGIGDFSDIGRDGILFQNAATGQAAVWQLNGTAVQSGATVGINPGTAWHVIA